MGIVMLIGIGQVHEHNQDYGIAMVKIMGMDKGVI